MIDSSSAVMKVWSTFWIQVALLCGLQQAAHADRHLVPQEYATLQAALDSCGVRDTVLVSQGTYYGNFVMPARSMTLMSYFSLTGDSLDFQNCRLNGNRTGCTLRTTPSIGDSIVIDGFTIENGLGYWTDEHYAGGLTILDSIHVHARNLVIQNNDLEPGAYRGRAIVSFATESSALLENIVARNDSATTHLSQLIGVSMTGRLEIRNLVVDGRNDTGSPATIIGNPVIVNGLEVIDFEEVPNFFVHVRSGSKLTLNDIHLVGNSAQDYFRVIIDANQRKPEILRFFYSSNSDYSTNHDSLNYENLAFRGDSLVIDSLIVANNYSRGCRKILRFIEGNNTKEIRHLYFADNRSGDGTWPDEAPHDNGQQIGWIDANVYDSRFENNITQLAHDPEFPDAAVGINGALIKIGQTNDNDSLIIENCIFRNNLLIDPDDYSPGGHARLANQGRVIYLEQYGGLGLRVSDCIFEGNLQPNHCPESSYEALGSVFYLYEYNQQDQTGSLFENLVFIDNDDGSLRTTYNSSGTMRNVRLTNNRRQGITAAARNWTLENILIEGQLAQDVLVPAMESRQAALKINAAFGSIVRNVTFVDCQVPVLIRPAFDDSPATLITNVVVADCEYTHLEHGGPNGFVPAEWEYSYLPELPENAGPGIVVHDARPFESEIEGGFVPALGSALVDGGHPGLEYNDIEDPALPGEPLWPARGELRNDMGYTGGPGYFPLENWTAIEEREREDNVLPQSLQLLPAWPNPFNPTTRLRFILPHAGKVKLAVYNLRGQQVRTLVDSRLPAGGHEVEFHAGELASGVYIARLKCGTEVGTQKLILLK